MERVLGMGEYGNLDTYNWTPDFVSSNRVECLRILQTLNSVVVDLLREKNYIDAITGMKKISLGLIKLQNENLGDFDLQIILLAMLMPEVSILGILDLDAPESARRDAALQYALDMANNPEHELAACYPIAKDAVLSYISDLKSGAPLAQIKQKYNFPADGFDALASLDRALAAARSSSSPVSSYSPSASPAAPSASSYSPPPPSTRSKSPAPPARSRGWIVLLILAAIGAFIFCTRMNIAGNWPAPSGDTQQPELSPDETADQLYQNNGFIFPDSDTALVEQWEIEALSDSDLTYAINEIYARHGYLFRNDELREYYEQFSWYAGEIPSAEFSVDCFNQIEQQNWNLLVNERDRRRASD